MTATTVEARRAAPARRKRNAKGHVGGRSMKAGWGTYLIIAIVTLVSAWPLYYTIVMASHTNAELNAKTPPLLPTGSVHSSDT